MKRRKRTRRRRGRTSGSSSRKCRCHSRRRRKRRTRTRITRTRRARSGRRRGRGSGRSSKRRKKSSQGGFLWSFLPPLLPSLRVFPQLLAARLQLGLALLGYPRLGAATRGHPVEDGLRNRSLKVARKPGPSPTRVNAQLVFCCLAPNRQSCRRKDSPSSLTPPVVARARAQKLKAFPSKPLSYFLCFLRL